MFNVGIFLGDGSSLRHGLENSDLKYFLFGERLYFDIVKRLRGQNIEIHLLKSKTLTTMEMESSERKYDLLISFECITNNPSDGISIRYLAGNSQMKQVADSFQKFFVAGTGFSDKGVTAVNPRSKDGNFMTHLKAPCIVAEPFPAQLMGGKMQEAVMKYEKILSSYVFSITKVRDQLRNP
jgi:hypothetical protein